MFDNAHWITYRERVSSLTFKNEYSLKKDISKVTLNITSNGWYLASINGNLVNTDVFSPGWTQFTKRIQFQSYDITKLVDKDKINLSVDIGEGWGGGDHFAWTKEGTFLYNQMSLIFEIEVTYIDGSNEVFSSDENVDTYLNEIIESTIYGGESQDQFRNRKYLGKAREIDIKTNIIPQEGERIIEGERIVAKSIFKDSKNNTIVDFGQNFSGIVEVTLKAKKGDKLSYTIGEVLDKDGCFYNLNYRKAKSTYSFILSNEEKIYRPKFSFLGGRYLKLIDFPENIKAENFVAVLVHSNLKKTFEFECGNALLNKFYKNVYYGQLSNFLDVPTDCPQRDERLGWTADAQVFASTAAINFDVGKFFRKYINEMKVCQFSDGSINPVIPFPGIYNDKSGLIGSGWSDACAIIPYEMYKAYGNKEDFISCIPMIKKWIEYLLKQCKRPFIPELEWNFGDWLALDKEQSGGCQGLTRFDLISSAFFAYDVFILIEALKLNNEDSSYYESLLNNIKKQYQNEFIKDSHMIGNRILFLEKNETPRSCFTQTGIVLTLMFDLCNPKDKKVLVSDLIQLIRDCNNKMTTGFLGTPYLLHVLSDNGEKKLAFDLLLNEEYPSWLYSVKQGATTVWEHYDGIKEDGSFWSPEMNSFNHYAYGSVFNWVFKNVVGIYPIKPGYKEILIKPLVDKRIGPVFAKFSTKQGDVVVSYSIQNYNLKYSIEIPKGVDVKIELENGYINTLKDGGVLKGEYKI